MMGSVVKIEFGERYIYFVVVLVCVKYEFFVKFVILLYNIILF